MTDTPAGWRHDPYGRFEQRYWDGQRWTEHVATGGQPQVDPLGDSPVIPFAIPPTAFPDEGTAEGAADGTDDPPTRSDAIAGFLDGRGPDTKDRPAPRLRSAVAGLGGAVVAVGILVIAAPDGDIRAAMIVTSLVLLAAALLLRLGAKVAELQAAATGVAVVAIPVFAIAATTSDGDADFLTGALLTVLYAAAWALPGFKGRNLFLGLAALSLLGALGSLTSDDDSLAERCSEYLDDGDWDRYDEECGDVYYYDDGILPNDLTDNIGTQGAIYLIGAGAFLGGTWWLDRRGYRGAGTALAAAGVIASLTGTVLLVDKFGETWGPLLMMAVGVVVSLVGTHGKRRATTWWGAALAAAGTVALVVTEMEPDSVDATGTALLIAGLLLVVVPLLAEPIRRSMANNGGPDTTPPAAAPPAAPLPPPGFDPGI